MCQKAPDAGRGLGQVLPCSLRRNQPCRGPDIGLLAPERGNKGHLPLLLVGAAVPDSCRATWGPIWVSNWMEVPTETTQVSSWDFLDPDGSRWEQVNEVKGRNSGTCRDIHQERS